jgi:hypothetical protein
LNGPETLPNRAPHHHRHSRNAAKIGRSRGGGSRPHKAKQWDDLDDFDEFDDDFRVQGKQAQSKPKKPKSKGKGKRNRRKMGQEQSHIDDDTPPLTLQERSLTAVADFIKSGKARRIVVMTGAGISTAAGSKLFLIPVPLPQYQKRKEKGLPISL